MNNRPTKSRNPKKMSKTDTKHVQNQRIELEPSRAWIKNMGAGTTKELLKRNSKHDKILVRCTTTPSPPIDSDLAENAKFNDVEKTMDNTMVSMQQIKATQPVKSVLEKTNGIQDSDSIAFHTCLDTTRIDANLSKSIDMTLINTKTTPAHSSTHFPFELTTISDEVSLYHESKGIMDIMSGRIGNEQKQSDDELLAMKRELNEGFDDALVCVTSPPDLTLVNCKIGDIKSSRAHELSIDLGAFDSPSIWSDSELKSMPLSPSFNSTELLSTNTIAQMNEVVHDLRHIGSTRAETNFESNANSSVFNADTPLKMPSSYTEFKSAKKSSVSHLSHMPWPLVAQASNQVPQTPSLAKGEFMHPVYMREDDVNRLIQSGYIFFTNGRLHYKDKQKNSAQKRIF